MVIMSLMILIIAIALTPSHSLAINPKWASSTKLVEASEGNESKRPSDSLLISRAPVAGGISPLLITRLTSIVFLFSGALSFNALYIQSIGSGLSLYSGLFQVTALSQSFDLFVFILASLILLPWPNKVRPGVQSIFPHSLSTAKATGGSGGIKVAGDSYRGTEALSAVPSYETVVTGPIVSEYSLIVLFSTLGSSLLLSSGNLLSLYLSIELQSFGVYILATIYRNSESATSAGLKYFLLGGLSSCLILLGAVLIYSYTGLIYFEDIYSLISASFATAPYSPLPLALLPSMTGELASATGSAAIEVGTIIQLGLILIFIGLLFKIAAAPFHNWAPDVYNDVPTIVTTWLTIMPKIAIVILAYEMISTMYPEAYLNTATAISGATATGLEGHWLLGSGLKNLLLISSFLSLVIGTVVGLAQIKIKRLLAYSTISHVGFLLLALSINTEESLESLLFYLVQYSITNLNTFFVLLSFGYILANTMPKGPNGSDISLISELKGQFWLNPLLSLSLAISLFSMAGIPPLVGFFAKAEVLYSATQAPGGGYYFLSFVAILVSVISAYYYLQIVRVLHFDQPIQNRIPSPSLSPEQGGGTEGLRGSGVAAINNSHSFIIATLTLSLVLFILKPSILLNSIHLIALNIFYS